WQAGPDVDELPDAAGRHVTDGAPEELPVLPGHLRRDRVDRQHLLGQLAVGGEVVLPAEPVVPHPRDVRPGGVEWLHYASSLRRRPSIMAARHARSRTAVISPARLTAAQTASGGRGR